MELVIKSVKLLISCLEVPYLFKYIYIDVLGC